MHWSFDKLWFARSWHISSRHIAKTNQTSMKCQIHRHFFTPNCSFRANLIFVMQFNFQQLREGLDCGTLKTFEPDTSPHDVASLLKEYLRDLPEPLLCRSLYPAFLSTQSMRSTHDFPNFEPINQNIIVFLFEQKFVIVACNWRLFHIWYNYYQ